MGLIGLMSFPLLCQRDHSLVSNIYSMDQPYLMQSVHLHLLVEDVL